MKQKKKYSPHLSVKRLRSLANTFFDANVPARTKQGLFAVFEFMDFVEAQRPLLGGKLPLGKGK